MSRAREVLIAFDQLLNAIFGGWADETISARAYRLQASQPYKTLRPLIDGLFFFQPEHCKNSFYSELTRSQLPKEYRDAKGIDP